MTRVRVIGIGSPAGDDQAGWLTVDALQDAGVAGEPGRVIEKLDRPGVALIPLLENADWVVLVDAMQSNGAPGRIHRFDQKDWLDYREGLSSHGLGVLDALLLARELGNLPSRLDLYGIEIVSAQPGDNAGPEICGAARHLAEMIAIELDPSRVVLGQSTSSLRNSLPLGLEGF